MEKQKLTTIAELLGKKPPTEAEKFALKIACEARAAFPFDSWLRAQSRDVDIWTDKVATIVLEQLKRFNFRSASSV